MESRGIDPTSDAIAYKLDVSVEDVEAMLPRIEQRDVSIDAPRNFEDHRSVGTTLTEEGPTPEDVVAGAEEDDHRREQLFEGLKILDARDRAIIRARYMRQRPATLAALGKEFGISRERVRQIELRALDRLRKHCNR